jgi:hypothetical protein
MCNGTSRTFGRTTTGGTAPFTQQWKLNGVNVGTGTTYTFNPTVNGTYTISITVTDANGCTYTDSRTIIVYTCCGMTASISPLNQTACTNQNTTFTASQTGGTAPITYSWTSQLSPASPIGQGTGTTKILNFSVVGTYSIVVTATDANGCTSIASTTLNVTNCTNCTCTPTLTLNGCVLNGSFTGAGCGNFTYQLQYSLTGTGWSVAQSGLASPGGTISYTPTANGFYRLVINAAGCGTFESATLNVNCVVSCNCTPGTLTYNTSTCLLSWTNPCSGAGYLADLERFNGTSWVYITQTTPYTPTQDGQYRIVYRKGGCPDVFSNTVTIELLLDCIDPWYVDSGIQYYLPEYVIGYHRHYSGSGSLTSYTSVSGCTNYGNNVTSSPTTSNWSINWGDGNTSTGATSPVGSINHTYATNGTYKQENDLNTSFGTVENDSYVYPDGNTFMPFAELLNLCGDGGQAIGYSREICGYVNIYISYQVSGSSLTTFNYNSHTVKINGVNYTVPITFVQGVPNVYWQIENTTPISISLSSINTSIIPIEVTVTANTNQVLKNKGYFRISCN